MRRAALVVLFAALSACASVSVWDTPADERNDTGAVSRERLESAGQDGAVNGAAAASGELLRQSQASQAAGQYEKAASDIERAIRIEPRNPYLWLELARIQFATGNRQQAAALAQKALVMADNDAEARRAAQNLLDEVTTM